MNAGGDSLTDEGWRHNASTAYTAQYQNATSLGRILRITILVISTTLLPAVREETIATPTRLDVRGHHSPPAIVIQAATSWA